VSRGAAWRQISIPRPLQASAAPAVAVSLVAAQLGNRRPWRRQGLLLVLLVGSAGRPALALPAPGGGALSELGARDAGAWAGVRRPRQSYEVAGGAAAATLPRSGLLVAQRLMGVVRCAPLLPPTSCPRQATRQLLHSPGAPVQDTVITGFAPCACVMPNAAARCVAAADGSHARQASHADRHACLPCLVEDAGPVLRVITAAPLAHVKVARPV
jgi:hypothetical protein